MGSVVVGVLCELADCEIFVSGCVVRIRHTLEKVVWLWVVDGLAGVGWIVWLSLCVGVGTHFIGEEIYRVWRWLDGWGCGEWGGVESVCG